MNMDEDSGENVNMALGDEEDEQNTTDTNNTDTNTGKTNVFGVEESSNTMTSLPEDTSSTTSTIVGAKDGVSEQKVQKTNNTKLMKNNGAADVQTPDTTNIDNNTAKGPDTSVPPKETPELSLGKGKRARIPNKRYSDIILSPPLRSASFSSASRTPGLENGERDDPSSTTIDENHHISPRHVHHSTPVAKKQRLVDITNPIYQKPFKFGWRRELVFRANCDTNNQRIPGDVYYYTPHGKKIRSMRELCEILRHNSALSIDAFTFAKEPIGMDDPEKEIVRDAKSWTKKMPPPRKSTSKSGGTPKLKTTFTSTPTDTLKMKFQTKNIVAGHKAKPLPNRMPMKKIRIDDENMEIVHTGIGDKNLKRKQPVKVSSSNSSRHNLDGKPALQPCSIRCQGVLGMVPTLQCHLCLCLYHNQCVGLAAHAQIDGYVCKNCQVKGGATSSSSPTKTNTLTPNLNISKITSSNNSNTTLETTVPKMNGTQMDDSNLTQRSDAAINHWLRAQSPNADVTLTDKDGGCAAPPVVPSTTSPNAVLRPQYIEYLAGRKFLILPKNSSPSSVNCHRNDDNNNNNNNNNDSNDVLRPNNSQSSFDNIAGIITSGVTITPIKSNDINNVNSTSTGRLQTTRNEMAPSLEFARSPRMAPSQYNMYDHQIRYSAAPPSAINNNNTASLIFSQNYLQTLSYGYKTLLHIFQYLKVQDLLRASCVCQMWHDIASHVTLWRTVRMKNSQVHSFDGLANSLHKHGTIDLDLRKMLLPSVNSGDDIWPEFSRTIGTVDTLRKIELCRCPATVIEQLPTSNPRLHVINAVTIKCDKMNLTPLFALTDLKELRLKSTNGLTLTGDLTGLDQLTHLTHLSLTSFRDLDQHNLTSLGKLVQLESLDLGECTNLPDTFGPGTLGKLVNLEKLRLEKGQDNCHAFEILEAVRQMPKLEQLELVNFDVKPGFDAALGACSNIRKLLLIPTYISQSATTNHMVLGAVLRLESTLTYFVWGVTLELLRVTELFVDQVDNPEKKEKKRTGTGDSIPVLKPVPLITKKTESNNTPSSATGNNDPPQVEILPLPSLQKLLVQNLPTTRIKILKIPFHATWRQSITDTTNV